MTGYCEFHPAVAIVPDADEDGRCDYCPECEAEMNPPPPLVWKRVDHRRWWWHWLCRLSHEHIYQAAEDGPGTVRYCPTCNVVTHEQERAA